jgi:hypothetical protein
MIKFYCPHCGQKLGVPDEYAARRVRCTKCNQPSIVPKPAQPAPEPVELEVLEDKTPQYQPASAQAQQQYVDSDQADQSGAFADDLNIGVVQSNPNLDALAAVRAQRNKQQRRAIGKSFSRSSPSSGAGSRLSGLALGAGKIPLSIAASLAFGIGVCILWTIVARLTGFIFVYFAVGVAAAAAYGLVIFTEHRNAGLGIAAIFIGFFCILIGKGMIAKWAIMSDPEFQASMNEGFEEAFASVPFNDMSSDEQSYLLEDQGVIYNMGVMDLWTQGKFDEQTSRQLSFYSSTLYMLEDGGQGPEGYEAEHAAVIEYINPWDDSQKTQMLSRHYDNYQQQWQTWVMDGGLVQGVGFVVAFIFGAFSLWDLLILPISAITAYKIAGSGG